MQISNFDKFRALKKILTELMSNSFYRYLKLIRIPSLFLRVPRLPNFHKTFQTSNANMNFLMVQFSHRRVTIMYANSFKTNHYLVTVFAPLVLRYCTQTLIILLSHTRLENVKRWKKKVARTYVSKLEVLRFLMVIGKCEMLSFVRRRTVLLSAIWRRFFSHVSISFFFLKSSGWFIVARKMLWPFSWSLNLNKRIRKRSDVFVLQFAIETLDTMTQYGLIDRNDHTIKKIYLN